MIKTSFVHWLSAALVVCAASAQAEIPPDYKPVVAPTVSNRTDTLVDLTGAVAIAERENKPLFIYSGASDCGPCHDYEQFLRKNWDRLHPSFEKVVVVDIRTTLGAPRPTYKVGDKLYNHGQFVELIGDSDKGRYYPRFWLVSPQLKQLKQVRRGKGTFSNVERHIEFLNPVPEAN
jgi:thiol-disulfide isomerase/thioredoxin